MFMLRFGTLSSICIISKVLVGLSFSAIFPAICFLASMPLKPAWIKVIACSTSGSSGFRGTLNKVFSSFFVSICGWSFSALISATCFLASMPLYPAWITVAALSTSGSSKSIFMTGNSFETCTIFSSSRLSRFESVIGTRLAFSLLWSFSSLSFSALISATCFLVSIPVWLPGLFGTSVASLTISTSDFPLSALISANCFLARWLRKHDWIFVAAAETSGSLRSMSKSLIISASNLSLSTLISAAFFLACWLRKHDWIFVAAAETSGSLRSMSKSLTMSASNFSLSALISATCFLASIPRNPAWIIVAAFSTSGSSRLIPKFNSGLGSSVGVLALSAFSSATCFLASIPL